MKLDPRDLGGKYNKNPKTLHDKVQENLNFDVVKLGKWLSLNIILLEYQQYAIWLARIEVESINHYVKARDEV